MRLIPTRIHGLLDYALGLVLIAAPWLFGFADGEIEMWLPVFLGASTIFYSLLTDYELGVLRVLPMPVHLTLDAASGVVLAVSPWLFGFAELVWVPHLAVGLLELGAAAVTERSPAYGPRVQPRGVEQADREARGRKRS